VTGCVSRWEIIREEEVEKGEEDEEEAKHWKTEQIYN